MIGLIDYGMGNLQSVKNSCEFLGHKTLLVQSPEQLHQVSHVILPGVGAFGKGMENLEKLNLIPALKERALENHVPFLGICLGMQLLADIGTEGGRRTGLGFIPGIVERLDDRKVRIPHIGWNDIRVLRSNPLIPADSIADYYFVHSYYLNPADSQDSVAVCDYGMTFPCVVSRGNIFGVQFHPEKSHGSGLELLQNFFKLTSSSPVYSHA